MTAELGATGALAPPRGGPPAPAGCPELAHLSLPELRGYRADLDVEVNRVSYWRRLVQARIDLLRSSERDGPDGPPLARLSQLLSDAQVSTRRPARVIWLPADEVPTVPELAGVWASSPAPGDPFAARRLLHTLYSAERQLSVYRSALRRKLDRATRELIARYHADPGSCLAALPAEPVNGPD
jgi:hypothetical protein